MDPIDVYLGKRIRNWASSYKPPANGKTRLLRAAALTPTHNLAETENDIARFDLFRLRFFRFTTPFSWHRDFSAKFFDWTIVYSFETSLVNLRLMY
jgi:hypothetical protein